MRRRAALVGGVLLAGLAMTPPAAAQTATTGAGGVLTCQARLAPRNFDVTFRVVLPEAGSPPVVVPGVAGREPVRLYLGFVEADVANAPLRIRALFDRPSLGTEELFAAVFDEDSRFDGTLILRRQADGSLALRGAAIDQSTHTTGSCR